MGSSYFMVIVKKMKIQSSHLWRHKEKTSDPGTSGLLSPYSKIKGLSFDDSMEPDNFRFEFMNAVKEVLKEDGVDSIDIDFDNRDDYYSFVNSVHRFNDDNIHVNFVSKKKEYDHVLTEEEEDLEETLSFSNAKKEEDKKPKKDKKQKKGEK